MLVLTRKINQRIIIGDDEIFIEVLGYSHGQVRLGITADKSVSVHREEIRDRIKREQNNDS